MRPLYTFDCETDPFEHGLQIKPFVWGLYSKGEGFRYFKETEAFVDYISKRDGIFFAHNGGRFDFIYLMPWINSNEEIQVINGRLAKAKIGKAEIRDSLCIVPTSLKSYKKDDIDYWKFKKEYRARYLDEILSYLEGDCRYLCEMVSAFRKDYGSSLTLASCALRYWKRLCQIPKFKTSPGHYHSFKRFYFGGRVQAVRRGVFRGDFQVVDINSAYPFAMRHRHPWGSSFDVGSSWPKADALGRAFLEFDGPSVGAFPLVVDGKLTFPDDGETRRFHATGWEVKTALEVGAVTKAEISLVNVYQFDQDVEFGEYVDHFYEKKKRAEKGSLDYIFAKLLMNSLYGKMSANPDKYSKFVLSESEDLETWEAGGWDYLDAVGDRALMSRPLDDGEKVFYNVATGASITGFVRAMLFKAIYKSKGFLYCDTDSIVAEAVSVDIGPELGQWELEGTASQVAIGGKKLYAMRGDFGKKKTKTASKGVRLKYGEIVQIARGKTITYQAPTPSGSYRTGFKYLERKVKATI